MSLRLVIYASSSYYQFLERRGDDLQQIEIADGVQRLRSNQRGYGRVCLVIQLSRRVGDRQRRRGRYTVGAAKRIPIGQQQQLDALVRRAFERAAECIEHRAGKLDDAPLLEARQPGDADMVVDRGGGI